MFTFYRRKTDHFTKWVDEKLKEMVLAHNIVEVEENSGLPNGMSQQDLPILSDGHESWTTEDEIREFLERLHEDLKFSRGITSDACYLDPENPKECL